MKYPEIGDMVTVVLENTIASGIVEEWGKEWIELKEPDTNSISCIKEKYVVGFKILNKNSIEDKPISIKGVKVEQLDFGTNPQQDVKSQALKMADAHLNRINSERKKVNKHLKKVEPLKKYPDNYSIPSFLKTKK